jgi:hypothetical protein
MPTVSVTICTGAAVLLQYQCSFNIKNNVRQCGLIKNIMGALFDFVDYAGHFILI